MPLCNEIYIFGGWRTPFGCFRWNLSEFSAADLASFTIRKTLHECGINGSDFKFLDSIYLATVLAANQGPSLARQAALKAGLPNTINATTVIRSCSSGLVAIILAIREILAGNSKLVLAGGADSLSNAPYLLWREFGISNQDALQSPGDQKLEDDILVDALSDPWCRGRPHPAQLAERTAEKYEITREMQDLYAIESYRRANEAINAEIFKREIVPITLESYLIAFDVYDDGASNRETTVSKTKDDHVIDVDQEPGKFNKKKMLSMKSAFMENGTITAGNASSLADGAGILLIGNGEILAKFGDRNTNRMLKPIARILAYSDEAINAEDFNEAADKAVKSILTETDLKIENIDLWEINEAYSVTAMVAIQKLHLDPEKVNVHGGCVALGHPFGVSGARLPLHLLHCLNKGQIGMAVLSNGGGEAAAILIEKL